MNSFVIYNTIRGLNFFLFINLLICFPEQVQKELANIVLKCFNNPLTYLAYKKESKLIFPPM